MSHIKRLESRPMPAKSSRPGLTDRLLIALMLIALGFIIGVIVARVII